MKIKQKIFLALFFLSFLGAGFTGGLLHVQHQSNVAFSVALDEIQALKPPVEIPGDGLSGAEGQDDPARPIMPLQGLQAENQEMIAWLTVDGTVIDYPVTQTTDNAYYLTHDAKKRKNKYGSLFLDFRVRPDFSDFNHVIYGHHMKNARMFHDLEKFKDRRYFDNHLTGRLYTTACAYTLDIFAVSLTKHDTAYYRYAFLSPAEKEAHLQMIQQTAMFYRDIGVNASDRLVALSTCSYEYKNARTVVLAKLIAE